MKAFLKGLYTVVIFYGIIAILYGLDISVLFLKLIGGDANFVDFCSQNLFSILEIVSLFSSCILLFLHDKIRLSLLLKIFWIIILACVLYYFLFVSMFVLLSKKIGMDIYKEFFVNDLPNMISIMSVIATTIFIFRTRNAKKIF